MYSSYKRPVSNLNLKKTFVASWAGSSVRRKPKSIWAFKHSVSFTRLVGPDSNHTTVDNPHTFLPRFFYFLFSFFTKIYFRFENLQEYTPAAPLPLPGGRDLAAWQRGGRGIFKKKSWRKLRAGPWGPVARQRGGRPWPPGCRATSSSTFI